MRGWGEPLMPYALAVATDGTVAAATVEETGPRLHLLSAEGASRRILAPPALDGVLAAGEGFVTWGDRVTAYSTGGNALWVAFESEGVGTLPVVAVAGHAIAVSGPVEQANSPGERLRVAAVDLSGELLFDVKLGDMNDVHGATWTEGALVLAGAHVDAPQRTVIRRLGDDGTSLWTDAGLRWTERPALISDGTGGVWFIDDLTGDAVRFDAGGRRSETVPCFGSVDGRLWKSTAGSSPALVFRTELEGHEDSWSWTVVGGPPGGTAAWLTDGVVEALAWTPRGSLLVALRDAPRILEVGL